MKASEILTLLPLLILAGTPLLVMLGRALSFGRRFSLALTCSGLAAAVGTLAVTAARPERRVASLLVLDGYALFFMGLLIAAAFLVALFSHRYLEVRRIPAAEYHALLLLATLGGCVLAAAGHLASFFLGFEVLSVSLYALIGYSRRRRGVEAAIKYLILGGTASAFLLFGMALAYAATGSLEIARVVQPGAAVGADGAILGGGMVLILVGVGFKLALVPFHPWTPDVYQGAPAPVAGLVATLSKGAVFALLLRYVAAFTGSRGIAVILLSIVAIASMIVGNTLAIRQENLRRILAYSSISHMGYLVVTLLASGALARTAGAFYLSSYIAAMLAAFGVITVLSVGDGETETIQQVRGLAAKRPWPAALLTFALLSLAGIPLTAGFIGKFYLVAAGADARLWTLVVVLVLTSVVGLYYYIRIIYAVFSGGTATEAAKRTRAHAPPTPVQTGGWMAAVGMTMLGAVLLVLGVYPAPLIAFLERVLGPGR